MSSLPGGPQEPQDESITRAGAPLPAADWYPDPERPDQLRYWNGEVWTDDRVSDTGRLNALGDWLTRTFSVLWERRIPVAILAFVIPQILWIPSGILAAVGVRDVVLDTDASTADGANWAVLIVAGVLAFLALLLTIVCWMGAVHQLYFGHRGSAQSTGDSFRHGLSRLPVLFAWILAIWIAGAAIMGIIVGLFFISTALGVVGFFIVFALFFWLWVKLSFIGVAATLGPRGSQTAKYSAAVSKGRFWPIAGRLFVIGIVGSLVGFAVNTVVNQITVVALGLNNLDAFALSSEGDEFLVDGEPLDMIEVAEYLPASLVVGLLVALTYAGYMVSYLIQASGLVGIYSDLRLPSIAESDSEVVAV